MPAYKTCLAAAFALGALAGGAPAATAWEARDAHPSPRPAAAASPAAAPARTTMIGRYDNELILSKIAVTDLVRSYEFYTKAIGLKLASPQLQPPKATDPEKDFAEYPLNFTGTLADPFFVIYKRKGQMVTPEGAANSVIGFKVPSAQAAVDRAVAAGAKPVGRPPATGPMAFGTVSDPDGYHIEFVQAANNPRR